MEKRWRNIIILMSIFIVIIFFVRFDKPSTDLYEPKEQLSLKEDYKPPFYFNYYFVNESKFSKISKQKLIQAFNIIREETNNSFIFNKTEDISNADFILNYSRGEEYGATLGESYVLGKEYYPYKLNYPAEITMFSNSLGGLKGSSVTQISSCGKGYPNIELHEILHGLGLDHSSNESSIMGEYAKCTRLVYEDKETIPLLYEEWEIE